MWQVSDNRHTESRLCKTYRLYLAAGIIFLGSILIGMCLMFAMARNWPQLIRLWYRTELIFLRKPYFAKGMTLKWRLRVVAFTVLVLALSTWPNIFITFWLQFFNVLVEHLFYIWSTLFLSNKHIEICHLDVNFLEYVFTSERGHIFDSINFSLWWIFPLEVNVKLPNIKIIMIWFRLKFLNISMTFCWTFVDVFIMAMSVGLATRFNQINERMQSARGKVNDC